MKYCVININIKQIGIVIISWTNMNWAMILYLRIIQLIITTITITIRARIVDLKLIIATRLTTIISITYRYIHTLIETRTVTKDKYTNDIMELKH